MVVSTGFTVVQNVKQVKLLKYPLLYTITDVLPMERQVPGLLKVGTVIPICKSWNRFNFDNYRPVSVFYSISKDFKTTPNRFYVHTLHPWSQNWALWQPYCSLVKCRSVVISLSPKLVHCLWYQMTPKTITAQCGDSRYQQQLMAQSLTSSPHRYITRWGNSLTAQYLAITWLFG